MLPSMDTRLRGRGVGQPVGAARAGLALLGVGLALAFAGCVPSGPVAPSSAPPAETTPASPASSPPATPAARNADSPLEPIDAYALCRAQTTGYYEGDFGLVDFAPFVDATVLERTDGLWFVYIEVDDGNREPALVESAGSQCIVGGTIGEPQWEMFGAISREVADEAIAGFDDPLTEP